ncbi:MAG TPA: B12-binding domain-containing protein [Candidatus Bathyarchaeia archaeon]|jgi:methanogenic corrinoid protein MtbC1|nr:B12-binding domain-containing protein [Candidatus Bathyarchaeia archaeon]
MTTEEQTQVQDNGSKQLTDFILKGDHENAARVALELVAKSGTANDVVDTISDAMNIVSDLHGMERYSVEDVGKCENAAEKSLEAVRPKIKIDRKKIKGRVMVGSLLEDPHSFDQTLLLTMLETGGFNAIDGGTDLSPEQVAGKVKKHKPDILAVPLVTEAAARKLVKANTLIEDTGGKLSIIAYGRGAQSLSGQKFTTVEVDSMSAFSKIAEILIAKA